MKLERDKVYRARNGSLWRVVCVDAIHNAPYVAIALPLGSGPLAMCWFKLDGSADDSRGFDLIAEHREPNEWVLYPDGSVDGVAIPEVGVRVREVLPDGP